MEQWIIIWTHAFSLSHLHVKVHGSTLTWQGECVERREHKIICNLHRPPNHLHRTYSLFSNMPVHLNQVRYSTSLLSTACWVATSRTDFSHPQDSIKWEIQSLHFSFESTLFPQKYFALRNKATYCFKTRSTSGLECCSQQPRLSVSYLQDKEKKRKAVCSVSATQDNHFTTICILVMRRFGSSLVENGNYIF